MCTRTPGRLKFDLTRGQTVLKTAWFSSLRLETDCTEAARGLRDGNQIMTSIIRMLAAGLALWPVSALAQAEYSTLRSWTACPTIQHTNEMLAFDGHAAAYESISAGSRVIVERAEQAPATRWMCIDHPAGTGTFTLCNWVTFHDEPKTWLCARSPITVGSCKWGPAEYFTAGAILAAEP